MKEGKAVLNPFGSCAQWEVGWEPMRHAVGFRKGLSLSSAFTGAGICIASHTRTKPSPTELAVLVCERQAEPE